MTTTNSDVEHLPRSATNVERRTFLTSATVGVAGGLLAAPPLARAQNRESRPSELKISAASFAQAHEPKALPFDSTKLNGLSARLIDSHWSNNYGGSVRTLNETKKRLAEALTAPETPPFVYDGLKREHLMRTGSVVLHELYFENLGGNGSADAAARAFIASAFGDFGRWETEFRRIAAGLGGGAGWVVLGYNRHFATLENYWLADHMHFPASTEPLLVMDMYEHSYQMDFGAAAARYIDAFFNNIHWERVLARVEGIK